MGWLYYIVGAIVAVIAVIAYILYRGYKRVAPKPIQGISLPIKIYS